MTSFYSLNVMIILTFVSDRAPRGRSPEITLWTFIVGRAGIIAAHYLTNTGVDDGEGRDGERCVQR